MKLLAAISLMLVCVQAGAFGVPTSLELVCVQDCKYGVPARGADGKWTTTPTDVKTFTYHVVVDSKKVMFYGNPLPENSVNMSVIRKAYLDGNKLRSTYFQDKAGEHLEIGTYTDDGEFSLNRPEGQCAMKLRPDLGKWLYQIDCTNGQSGEFELSGILARTQKEQPKF